VLPGRHKRGLTRAHCCAQGQIVRLVGLGQAGDLFSALDREALASIGVDLDGVRARIKAAFGPDAFTRAGPGTCRRRRPAVRSNPLARLRHPRRARPDQQASPGRHATGHIWFTPRAK
jgi:hypothetical protein